VHIARGILRSSIVKMRCATGQMLAVAPNTLSIQQAYQLRTIDISMSAALWQLVPTRNWVTTYRGVRVLIKRNETGKPMEIGWYINGSEAESIPLDCDEELAKEIGTQVVDQRIPVDEEWQQAEKKDREPDLS
jgi:hypothetical protein